MRRLIDAATAIGAWTAHHRIIASLAAFAILAAIMGSTTWGVLARQSGLTEEGTSAPGSHKWYSISDEEAFCASCHNAIRTEVDASSGYHANDDCLGCHAPSADGHAASPALCADCHYSGGGGGGASCHEGCHFNGSAPPLGCTDCHDIHGGMMPHGGHGGDQATELASDAHASFYISIGETPETASWVCKSCHTEVRIAITEHINPSLPLQLGPTYP